jgi:internalin A
MSVAPPGPLPTRTPGRWRRAALTLVAAAVAVLGAVVVAPAAEASDPPPANQKYQNVLSHLCLTPAGGSTSLNATMVQYSCEGYLAIRTWNAYWNSAAGAYQIQNAYTHLCLSPAGGSTGLNVVVVQYSCDGDPSRLWRFVPRTGVGGQGPLDVRNVKSNRCLSPAGGSTSYNAAIVQYTCDSDPSRGWKVFTPRQIQSANAGGYCLTPAGSSGGANVQAVTYYCNLEAARLWHLVPVGTENSSTFYLENVYSTFCLSPAGAGTAVNTPVVQFYCDSNPARFWRLIPEGNGAGQLQNVATGLCLSPAGEDTGINVGIVQRYCDRAPSRIWRLLNV